MSLELLHKIVFVGMFLMFLASNYVIVLKFLQLRRRPQTSPQEAYEWMHLFREGLWWLDFSATTAPLVGLLGTIIALIEAFNKLTQLGVSNASQISSAIGFALVATAVGILLSLWNYLFFKLFSSRLHQYRERIKATILQEVLK